MFFCRSYKDEFYQQLQLTASNSSLHILGVYLFTSGFLLTRLVLDHKSECGVRPLTTQDEVSISSNNNDRGCWHPQTFDKAIVVVVDALRYDFTIPLVQRNEQESAQHYHNQFSVLYETASQSPQHAVLRPFIADPPTTTLQRLKGLTTGTLPTFIDAGSNFAGTSIEEDNLVHQMKAAGKRMVHLGDDTWHALFPGYFEADLTHPFDSFNVWDLHTVDDGVNKFLFPLLDGTNSTRWDVIFAHYLGVDHAGHRYGPDHPSMASKLRQMDGIFRELMASIDDTTLLVVMGDHGMDSKGDHGGESDDEIQAAIWLYSKKAVFGRRSPSDVYPPKSAKERPIAQIDIVPTLALLLGLPIPFNNLGAPIEEAFVGPDGSDVRNLALVNQVTAAQINRYQSEYAKVQKVDDSVNARPTEAWENATRISASLQTSKKPTKSDWEATLTSFQKYQQENISMCRALWAQFSVSSMLYGISTLAFGTLTLLLFVNDKSIDKSKKNSLYVKFATVGSLVGFISGILFQLSKVFTAAIGAEICVLVVFICDTATLPSTMPRALSSWVSILFPILLSIGFASNSFTIWEDEILLFFLATIGTLLLIYSLRVKEQNQSLVAVCNSIVFMFLSRLSSLSRLCREEQMPHCRSTYYASASSSTSASWQLLIPLGSALVLPDVIKLYYRGKGPYYAALYHWFNIYFRAGLVLTTFYWTLQTADDNNWSGLDSDILRSFSVSFAQIALLVAFGAGYYTFYRKIGLTTNNDAKFRGQTNKANDIAGTDAGNGRANASCSKSHYGLWYFVQVSIWVLVVMLVEKPMGSGSVAILCWQILCVLETLSATGLAGSDENLQGSSIEYTNQDNLRRSSLEELNESDERTGQSLNHSDEHSSPLKPYSKARRAPSFIGPIALGLLGSFHFFKTGHQATLASIQWESAFIPFRTIHYPWSPLLVVLNTFGAQIICAIAVPAIPLWRSRVGRLIRQTQRKSKIQHDKPQHAQQDDTLQRQEEEEEEEGAIENDDRTDVILSDIAICLATHILFYAVINLATVMWAGWLRRHLMLFRIFSPRFMTGAAVLLVVDVVGIIFGLGGSIWIISRGGT